MNRHLRVMLSILLIVGGVFVFLPSGYTGAGGMVINHGFEWGLEGVPFGWNLTGNASRVNIGPVYAGNWSARITGGNDTLTQWFWMGNVTWPLSYNVWGWIFVSSNVTGIIAFDFWTGTTEMRIQVSPTTELSANHTTGIYVQRANTIEAPIGATYLRIRLLGTGWIGLGEVRFDEVGFYPLWPIAPDVCFIATAAYGTETAVELETLRDFRDEVLLRNAVSSLFVEAYYKISPPIADIIANNDFLSAIVREVLIEPVVYVLRWSESLWRA